MGEKVRNLMVMLSDGTHETVRYTEAEMLEVFGQSVCERINRGEFAVPHARCQRLGLNQIVVDMELATLARFRGE